MNIIDEHYKTYIFSEYVIEDVIQSLQELFSEEDKPIVECIAYGVPINTICKQFNKQRTYVKRIQQRMQKLIRSNNF